MKTLKAMFSKKALTLKVLGASALLSSGVYAEGTMVSTAQTALSSAGADALTVGGYVVAAIAGLVVVGMIITMMRKAG